MGLNVAHDWAQLGAPQCYFRGVPRYMYPDRPSVCLTAAMSIAGWVVGWAFEAASVCIGGLATTGRPVAAIVLVGASFDSAARRS